MKRIVLRLYVMGKTPRSMRSIDDMQRICSQEFEGEVDFEVVDVLERPQLAEDEKILATPTVIKKLPPPIRRIIGDFSNKENVLLGLDLLELVQ